MRKRFLLLSFILISISCDDGDIITVEFDFDDTFLACGELVFYQIKENPYESLSLKITNPAVTIEDLIQVDDDGALIETELQVSINGTTNQFNYRTYSSDPSNLFCNDVPPSDVSITQDLSSSSGTAEVTISLIEDDNDGIPADFEDENLDGDNDPTTNPTDRDGDGIPDYLDVDDDGDNVLTIVEIDDDNEDGDDNPLTNPKDTDMDGIPNYLDSDDDGDGVLTIDEENNTTDQNPANDFTNPEIADYLNPEVSTTVLATAYRPHAIQQNFTIALVIYSVQFSNITQEEFDFGTLQDSRMTSSRIITPEF